MITARALTDCLSAAGLHVIRFQQVGGNVSVAWIKWEGDATDRMVRDAIRPVLVPGVDLTVNCLGTSGTYGQVTVTALPPAPTDGHMDRMVFGLEEQVGHPVTVTVPSSVHYSGNITGRVMAIAYPATSRVDDPRDVPVLVLDAECRPLTVPLDAVMSWEPQS